MRSKLYLKVSCSELVIVIPVGCKSRAGYNKIYHLPKVHAYVKSVDVLKLAIESSFLRLFV